MISNPYVVGQWVRGERFYGREALIQEILEGYRSWIWLLGTRRIGKTSLLKQLEQLTSGSGDGGYFPVFWDLQGAEDLDGLQRGFLDALWDAESRLATLRIDHKELEGSDLFDSVGRLRRRLRSSGRKLLLLCDETEELIKLQKKDPSLLRKLRRLLQSQEEVRSVLASTIRLWALTEEQEDTSPFLHGFAPPFYIRGLEDPEARSLIAQEHLPTASRPPFGADEVEQIRARCDNHPYLMQIVCKKHLEVGNLDEALESVATNQMVIHFFAVDFEMLSERERDVLKIISESSSANTDSIRTQMDLQPGEAAGILQQLESLGFIRRNEEKRFVVVNYFFRHWLRERRDSRLPPLEKGAVKPRETREEEHLTQSLDSPPFVLDNRYECILELGRGGTGVVYKAFDRVLRETIAIKTLKPEYASHPELMERMRQEILLARDLDHPNILKIYHLGECAGKKYLAMKWIEGLTLARMIARDGALPIPRVIELSGKIASALEAAHARKIIHRDIKPHNILIDQGGEPYLLDFGLARLLSSPGMTRSGVFIGTPDYASPEQANAFPPDERSDLYSLGVVMYEMATGRRPFAGSGREVLDLHRSASPPDPAGIRPDLPRPLSGIILSCLEKRLEDRIQSARRLRQSLEWIRTWAP